MKRVVAEVIVCLWVWVIGFIAGWAYVRAFIVHPANTAIVTGFVVCAVSLWWAGWVILSERD